jgi:hypothetical protein
MTSVKAKLVVTLKADDVVVAEVEDAALWQRVLSAIQGGGGVLASAAVPSLAQRAEPTLSEPPAATTSDAVEKMAREIGVQRAVVEGALSPTNDTPFIHLNSHNWEAMRKQLPVRGRTAVSSITAAATLLALWFRSAGLGNPTQAQALAILKGIGEDDKNPSRGVRAATWLIARAGGQVQVNASEISTAVKFAKCFCTKQWGDWQAAKTKSE